MVRNLVICNKTNSTIIIISTAQQSILGQGVLIMEVSRSHSDTPHSVGILWMSDQTDTETFTWQHTHTHTHTHNNTNRLPCSRADSNQISHQENRRRPTPSTARSLESAILLLLLLLLIIIIIMSSTRYQVSQCLGASQFNKSQAVFIQEDFLI